MNKEFIPYEQALELRKLGFDEKCLAITNVNSYELKIIYENYNEELYLPTPLFSQAFRWFREKKLSDSCVCRYQGNNDGGVYYYYVITKDFGVEETRHFKEGIFTYEEAELVCLNKLIEIVKNK
jgi:hypothetical protein